MSFVTPEELAAIEEQRQRDVVRTRKGQLGRWSKLSGAQLERIRVLKALGESQNKIARDVGCSQACVSMILNGKRRG